MTASPSVQGEGLWLADDQLLHRVEAAETLYREAIDRLQPTRLRQLAHRMS